MTPSRNFAQGLPFPGLGLGLTACVWTEFGCLADPPALGCGVLESASQTCIQMRDLLSGGAEMGSWLPEGPSPVQGAAGCRQELEGKGPG